MFKKLIAGYFKDSKAMKTHNTNRNNEGTCFCHGFLTLK